jgi:hypothetical protein
MELKVGISSVYRHDMNRPGPLRHFMVPVCHTMGWPGWCRRLHEGCILQTKSSAKGKDRPKTQPAFAPEPSQSVQIH